ncbi:MAG: response regulator [Hyphomicrobium sp.]|nr:response regulator [Hyphomicrobium sp.]
MARIVLADDDATTRAFIERALKQDGHAVTLAQDGVEAFERLSQTPADVLVSDIEMPGLDGIELAKRALTQQPELKVLLMSGYAEELERARGLSGAQVATLAKPASLDAVKAAVRALIG